MRARGLWLRRAGPLRDGRDEVFLGERHYSQMWGERGARPQPGREVNRACVRFYAHGFPTDLRRIAGYGSLLHLRETNGVPFFEDGYRRGLVASESAVHGAADPVSALT